MIICRGPGVNLQISITWADRVIPGGRAFELRLLIFVLSHSLGPRPWIASSGSRSDKRILTTTVMGGLRDL